MAGPSGGRPLSEEWLDCLLPPKVSFQEGADPFLTMETPEWTPDTFELQDASSSSTEAECNGTFTLSTNTWMARLQQMLPDSPMLAALQQSLTPASQQDKGTGLAPASVVSAAIRMFPPSLLESGRSASPGEGSALLRQDTCTSTPVSVAVWTSPANFLEARSSTSMEERSPVLHQAVGTSVASGSEEPAETSASPPSLLEAGVNTVPEEAAPVPQQGRLAGVAHVGCSCHGIWTSPLSLLESGLSASPEETAPASAHDKVASAPPASAAPVEVWTSPSGLPEARAKAASVPPQEKGTCVTPVCVVSAAAWTSPPSLLETGVNTSLGLKPCTKESTAETDSLLWHCSRDQLSGLSRAELEGRLESTLIIVEVLSHQIRACQQLQWPAARVGPAGQREVATQTPISEPKEEERLYRDLYVALSRRHRALQQSRESEQDLARRLASAVEEMRAWSSDSRLLQDTVDASFRNLQEDRRALAQQQKQTGDLLSRCQGKLQRWDRKREEMKTGLEEAQKAKAAADQVLESVRSHAGARIERLEQGGRSQRRLHALLQEANGCKADLSLGYARYAEEGDRLARVMQHDWAQMLLDYEACRSAVARCRATTKRMEEAVEAARRECAQHQEVCRKLEKSTEELVAALGRVNELMEANAGLDRDLKATLQKVSAVEGERERLQRENETLSQQLVEKKEVIDKLEEETARLSGEKARAEQERNSTQRDLREVSDCQEFLEQENQIARRQLSETEEELKATLATLWQRGTQLGDLKDAHEKLRQEHEALCKELASAKAEIRGTEACTGAFSEAVREIGSVQAQLLETADFLQAVLRGEVVKAPQRSSGYYTPAWCTPHRLGASFVDSVLQAAAEKGTETPGLLSDTTAFAKAAPVVPPTQAEVRDSLAVCVVDLREVADQLRLLSSQRQKAAQEEVESLQAEILQLEQQLESLERRLGAEIDAGRASITKLNKALHVRIQNEKELQEVLWQQDEKLRLLTDQSAEVTSLQEEVAQLKHVLRRSETEAAALWEELRGTKPADTNWVQEKIWLRQEVGKLRELLLQKDTEHTELWTNYLGQVRCLEERLHQTQQVLKKHKKLEAEVREVLSAMPAEVTSISEVQRLSELLA